MYKYLLQFINRDKRCLLRCVKSVHIRNFSSPYFPASRLNMEIYSVLIPNARKYGRENSEYGHFLCSVTLVDC